MSSHKVSIILPTYNRIDCLKDCICSVLAQTYSNWELIVVDDSSTNDVHNFIKNSAVDEPRINYYRNKKRKGLPGSRNVGISISTGDLIFFIEDDTIIQQNTLEILVNAYLYLDSKGEKIGSIAPSRPWLYSAKSRDGILDDHILIGKNLKLKVPCIRDNLTGIVYSNFIPTFDKLQEVPDVHSCSLYPKNVLKEVDFYDEIRYGGNFLYEETDLNYRILKKGYKFYFEPKAVLYHKIVPAGGCRVKTIEYGYFFILNHMKFIEKNYGIRAFYIIPLFFTFITYSIIRFSFKRAILCINRGKS